jgi:hypothetical protein
MTNRLKQVLLATLLSLPGICTANAQDIPGF